MIGAAGDVARAHPLADDALAAKFAGVLEDLHSVAVKVLAQVQTGADIAHDLRQLVLADLDRHGPQVFAVELQQIECEQHRLSFDLAAVPQQVEDRKALPSQTVISPSIRQDFTLSAYMAPATDG